MQRFILIYRTLTIIGGDQHTESVRQTVFEATDRQMAEIKVKTFFRLSWGHTFLPETLRANWEGQDFKGVVVSEKQRHCVFTGRLYTQAEYEQIKSKFSETPVAEDEKDALVDALQGVRCRLGLRANLNRST